MPPPEPMIRLLMILLTLLPLVGATPARAQQPRALEHVPPNPGNTSAEQWVWEQAQKGEIADLREYCQQQTCGAIGADFIKQVLTEEPWRSVLARGLRIDGARVVGLLDLSNAHIVPVVWLDHSRFEGGEAKLNAAQFDGSLTLDGSTFDSGIN